MKSILKSLILLALLVSTMSFAQIADPDPHRFDKEINSFIRWDQQNAFQQDAILFVGSSSIRMWMTHDAFPDLTVLNRGFGGAHISDVQFFIQETVLKYKPRIILFYCGDNDIAGKKSPEQVFGDYQKFVATVQAKLPLTHIGYIPIKPSIARWNMWPDMEKTNKMVQKFCDSSDLLHYVDIATPMLEQSSPPPTDLFLKDGLHLTEKGYAIWNRAVDELIR